MSSQSLYRLGRFAAIRPWRVIGVWLVASILVVGASAMFGQKLEDSFGAPGLESQTATDLLAGAGDDQAGLTAQVVATPLSRGVTFTNSAEADAALGELRSEVDALPKVLNTTETVSPDGRVALIRVQYPILAELEPADLERLKALRVQDESETSLQVEMDGDLFFAFEEPETGIGEVTGLIAAVIILLVAFGSVIAMGLPIGMALFGLAIGVSSLSLIAYFVEIPSWAPVIGSMVGLGVGIDYALFLVTRHREYLARGLTVEDAAGRSVATAGQSVLFAGGIVVIAILGLGVAGIPFVTAGGIAIAVIVLIMVSASVTLLPAALGLAGPRINGWRVSSRRTPSLITAAAGWSRWGGHVSRNATAYAIGGTVLLLALAAPMLALRVGMPDDGTLPVDRTERRAYDLVAEGFGPGANGPFVIAVELNDDSEVVTGVRAAIQEDPGIASVAAASVNTATGVSTVVAVPTTGPQDEATVATLDRLRASVLPSALDGSRARAYIGGQTATLVDVGGKVADRLPWFIGTVIGLSVLLLMVVFRSVVVPLKAAVLNLLSIGASFGVLVMVFQWGWAADLIGLESTVPIVSFIPLFMFAILFGLSMDYEVFLLSRIREEYLASGDNTASVIAGIAKTGRVITAAAAIMTSVFLGFVAGNDPTTKMFGLGLAVAILIDATIVRLVLVPALMTLLGRANWWMPEWLDRQLDYVFTRPKQSRHPECIGLANFD